MFKAGLRGDIRDELAGVLKPLEFSLVKRLAGQALEKKSGWRRCTQKQNPIIPPRTTKNWSRRQEESEQLLLDPRPTVVPHPGVAG